MGVSPREEHSPAEAASRGDASMIRREEELRVRTVRESTGRVVLRKRIVEEEQTFSVVVQREEAEVVEEAVADAPTGSGAQADPRPAARSDVPFDVEASDPRVAGDVRAAGESDDPDAAEIVLFEQRPVVTLEWVPVERVRLDRTVVRGEETVTGEVRREVVDEVDDRPGDHLRPEHR